MPTNTDIFDRIQAIERRNTRLKLAVGFLVLHTLGFMGVALFLGRSAFADYANVLFASHTLAMVVSGGLALYGLVHLVTSKRLGLFEKTLWFVGGLVLPQLVPLAYYVFVVFADGRYALAELDEMSLQTDALAA